jgi:hypothetical protein
MKNAVFRDVGSCSSCELRKNKHTTENGILYYKNKYGVAKFRIPKLLYSIIGMFECH